MTTLQYKYKYGYQMMYTNNCVSHSGLSSNRVTYFTALKIEHELAFKSFDL